MRYTILAVDRAGTPWEVCQTDHSDSAQDILAGLRKLGDGRTYWPNYTDDPEAGDCEADIDEFTADWRE